jgi:hypothetical protein
LRIGHALLRGKFQPPERSDQIVGGLPDPQNVNWQIAVESMRDLVRIVADATKLAE